MKVGTIQPTFYSLMKNTSKSRLLSWDSNCMKGNPLWWKGLIYSESLGYLPESKLFTYFYVGGRGDIYEEKRVVSVQIGVEDLHQ